MPMDELAGGALRLIGRFILDVLIQGFFEVACYFLGLWTLRIITLGRYPARRLNPGHEMLCMLLGLVECIPLGWIGFGVVRAL